MRINHSSSRYKFIHSVILSMSSLPVLAFAYFFRSVICFNIILGLVLLYNFGRRIYWIINEVVLLGDKTITYKNGGVVIEASWDMLEDVEKVFLWTTLTKQECMVIDNSNVKVSTAPFPYLLRPRSKPFNLQKVIIPISCFSENWRNSELGHEFKKYAPHLFTN